MKKFNCYKSLVEKKHFKHELGVVIFEISWRNGELLFENDNIPEKNDKGDYLDTCPDDSSYFDEWSDATTAVAESEEAKAQLLAAFDEIEDYEDEDELSQNGFELDDVTYDILSGDGYVNIEDV